MILKVKSIGSRPLFLPIISGNLLGIASTSSRFSTLVGSKASTCHIYSFYNGIQCRYHRISLAACI